MKLLLTNDDGIDADGLQALLAARAFGEPVVVAPAGPQSGCSHTVDRSSPRRAAWRGRFAVHGTPADCTRIGLLKLVPDATWVLSGINHGGNLGADVYYSGTVAAVREAVLHGWPGIALSHYRKKGPRLRLATRRRAGPAACWPSCWRSRVEPGVVLERQPAAPDCRTSPTPKWWTVRSTRTRCR